jgi:hypothetical protein
MSVHLSAYLSACLPVRPCCCALLPALAILAAGLPSMALSVRLLHLPVYPSLRAGVEAARATAEAALLAEGSLPEWHLLPRVAAQHPRRHLAAELHRRWGAQHMPVVDRAGGVGPWWADGQLDGQTEGEAVGQARRPGLGWRPGTLSVCHHLKPVGCDRVLLGL